MAWMQPWDVVCPRCKADKGKVCRAPYSNRSLAAKCHSERWNVSLGLRRPTRSEPNGITNRKD